MFTGKFKELWETWEPWWALREVEDGVKPDSEVVDGVERYFLEELGEGEYFRLEVPIIEWIVGWICEVKNMN